MSDEPKPSDDEAEPLSSRDVELEPVSLRDIEMILAPGRAPPPLAKSETLADKMKRLEAARETEGAGAAADEKSEPAKERKLPPPKKAETKKAADLGEALEGAKAPLPPAVLAAQGIAPPEQPKDSGLADLRQLAASHPPPALKRGEGVDFDPVSGDAPPPPPIPPDFNSLLSGKEGERATKAREQPKAPLKKREPKKEDEASEPALPVSERAPKSVPGSKRPGARSDRPRTTGVPAKSIEPSRPGASVRPSKPPPKDEPAGGGRMILIAVGGALLLGVGYFLGKSSVEPPRPPTPAATVTVTVTVPVPMSATAQAGALDPVTAEPVASETASASAGASAAPPSVLTGAVATGAGTATTKPTATPGGGEFDKAAANAALSGAVGQAASCKKEGDPSGRAQVSVTFAPSGRVTIANVNGPPFAGTATGGCIAKAFRSASVAPFSGDAVTVSKTVNIP